MTTDGISGIENVFPAISKPADSLVPKIRLTGWYFISMQESRTSMAVNEHGSAYVKEPCVGTVVSGSSGVSCSASMWWDTLRWRNEVSSQGRNT